MRQRSMDKKNGGVVPVEILAPDTPLPPAIVGQSAIDRAVERKFMQLVGGLREHSEQWQFEPFFRSRQVAYEIRRLQTVPERKLWATHFEKYGCLSCHKQNLPHAGCGLCANCYARVSGQLKRLRRELEGAR